MTDLVSPIVDIATRLWTCCARHTRYLCKLQENNDLLSNAMKELKEAKNDVQRRVDEEEADPNEPKIRTEQVRGWLERVEKIEDEVEVIMHKAYTQLSRAKCLGGCCSPNNCCSNYKLGKSIAKKIPSVDDLKVKGDFQELTFVVRPTNYLSKLQDNKILLKSAMAELKNVRIDVQRKVDEEEADPIEPKKRTEQVCGWLQSVEIIEGEVERIMQTSHGLLSNAECREKDKLVVMKMASVGELKRNGNFEKVTYRLPPSFVQDINMVSTVGMESMFDNVWRLINNNTNDQVRIMGLHGHGGVGKTTLLEKINNEFNKISEHDHVVIFVVVSKPINVQAIQTQIGERLRLSLQGDERRRANEIFNTLRNKKFVILLDDIWEKIDLQSIGIPTPLTIQCNYLSKVIFTTRSESVCGLMEATHTFQVECLPWDKAWSLFQDKVGEKALNSFSGARELAKHVAKECGGLPLALITIGRVMSTKKSVEEWRDAIKTLRRYASKFEGMGDKVFPRLKLSYDNLRDETEKSCFCYCALFPEDHSIKITKLVELWIAEEGFLLDGFDNNNLDEARDRGHTIIGSLKRACLLESNGEKCVKMHDVIRDLALWIVNGCKSSNNTTGKFLVAFNVCERWRNAERIFWNGRTYGDSSNNYLELEEPPTSPNLQTLLLGSSFSDFSNLSIFQFTPFLRVLDMSNIQLTELPTSICQLSGLQYLNLSGTNIQELPIELRKLVKLKFLDLSFTISLVKIPPGVIAYLSGIQVLKLRSCQFKDWGLKEEDGDGGISLGEQDRMKQLQGVTLTISTSEELLFNQKLRRICTNIVILESCINLKTISLLPPSSTTSNGGLGNLVSTKVLSMMGCIELEEMIQLVINDEGGETNTTTTTSTATATATATTTANKLEKLYLENLHRLNNFAAAQQQQHYLHKASSFQSLYSISIVSCYALKNLKWLVYVENLKNLWVQDCEGLATIIELGGDDHGLEEGASGGGRVFRRLKTLQVWDLPNLKSICSHALVFPSIEIITVIHCQKLKKLPLDSRSNINNTLQEIRCESDWWSKLQWEDETIESKFHPYLNKDRTTDDDVEDPAATWTM